MTLKRARPRVSVRGLQVIAQPARKHPARAGALPGSVHDKKAEWIWGVPAELEAAGLVTPGRQGLRGSSHAKIPYYGKNKPKSKKEANRAHARLRAPGKRANAQLKTWRILRQLRCCPDALLNSPRPSTHCRPTRHKRMGSRDMGAFTGKILSAMGSEFGCHAEKA